MEKNQAQTNDYADYYGSVVLMNQVDTCIEQLIEAVLKSEEYQRYKNIKEKIKQQPEKERAIQNFRKRNFLLQKSKDNMDLFEEIDRLEQEFSLFRQEPLVEEYLTAELSVCRMVQKINLKLMEQIDFETIILD